jgi:hypothetical protein
VGFVNVVIRKDRTIEITFGREFVVDIVIVMGSEGELSKMVLALQPLC